MSSKERKIWLQKQTEEFRRHINQITKGRNLYVKNIPLDLTDEELQEFFGQFGEVEKSKIMKDPESGSKGFGFVLFKNIDDAKNAIHESTLKPIRDQSVLYVALFKCKEERQREKAKLNRQIENNRNQPPAPMMSQMNQPMSPMMNQMNQQMSPMMNQMNQQMSPMMAMSSKDRLKAELIDKNITGQQLKDKLKKVTEEQARVLCEDQVALNQWINESI